MEVLKEKQKVEVVKVMQILNKQNKTKINKTLI